MTTCVDVVPDAETVSLAEVGINEIEQLNHGCRCAYLIVPPVLAGEIVFGPEVDGTKNTFEQSLVGIKAGRRQTIGTCHGHHVRQMLGVLKSNVPGIGIIDVGPGTVSL